MSAPVSRTLRLQVDEVGRRRSGWPRGSGRCRRARSRAPSTSTSSRPSTAGAVSPAIPLPASTTTSRCRPCTGARESRYAGVVGEHVLLGDGPGTCSGRRLAGRRPGHGSRPARSPCRSGAAKARHILMPLYCAGLWLAVNIAPGPRQPPGGEVELVGGGEPDHDVTSAPASAAPSANARDMPGEDGRMSCPTTTLVRPGHRHEGVAHPTGEVVVDLVGHDVPGRRTP